MFSSLIKRRLLTVDTSIFEYGYCFQNVTIEKQMVKDFTMSVDANAKSSAPLLSSIVFGNCMQDGTYVEKKKENEKMRELYFY